MKAKHFISLLFIFICIYASAQITNSGCAVPYNPKFPNGTSLEIIKNYLTTNASSLDPIEGLYDVTWKSYITYEHYSPRETEDSYTIAIVKNDSFFYFYAPYNDNQYIPHSWLIIEPIGSTGIYNFIFTNKETPQTVRIYSKQRVPLEHGILFDYQHKFTQDELLAQDSKKYGITGTVRNISGIKIFPDANAISTSQPKTWTGTGFALKNKYIVTNFHVVDGASKISVKGIQGNFNKTYTAEVVGLDKINDLALLSISDSNFTGFGSIPYSISSTISEVGSNIYVLGYPLTSTMGDEIKLTTGIISSKTGFQGDVALYQISAPIQPGNSGGPLFDSKGNVIGVVSAKHAGAENVGYAIKSNYLRNLVESCVSSSIIPTVNSVSTLSLPNKVKQEKNFVFFIKCSSIDAQESGSSKVINSPSYDSKQDKDLKISKITLTPQETILECSFQNNLYDGWMNISKGAYIQIGASNYPLQRTEGIALSPNYTYFDFVGQTRNFKLYFPPIPLSTSTINFIEGSDSDWKVYGLKLQ